VKKFRVRLTPEAADTIRKLHPDIKNLIRQAMDTLIREPMKGDPLQGELLGFRSMKPQRYRILYKVDMDKFRIDIYHVGQRRDVYENFKKLLEQIIR
jgi:addiction module RelE/StbE family toxin